MSLQNLALFVVMAIAVTLSPGPDILLVIAVSVARGVRAGLAATLGFATGLIVHTTIATTGLALVIRNSPVAFRVVQLFGAAYLVFLAVKMMWARENREGASAAPAAVSEPKGLLRIYQQCILMNVLNPKVTLFFLAFLPGFVAGPAKEGKAPLPVMPALPVWGQLVALSALFAACTLVCFGACAAGAGFLSRGLRRNGSTAVWLRRGTAVLFAGLAVVLVVRGAG